AAVDLTRLFGYTEGSVLRAFSHHCGSGGTADALASGASWSNPVGVQIPASAPTFNPHATPWAASGSLRASIAAATPLARCRRARASRAPAPDRRCRTGQPETHMLPTDRSAAASAPTARS